MQSGSSSLINRIVKLLPLVVIALGALLRLWVYIDNRPLWTDEVNVALNIIERSFGELTTNLDYGQYAPPIYLWITKTLVNIFGNGEKAFRLYPLFAGIGALFLLRSILSKLTKHCTVWYPVLILATGIFFLHYSTEVKQYMPDAFISLLLTWFALRIDIRSARFAWLWVILGSIAIWSSMPSVFVLAAVGCYYASILLERKDYKRLPILVLVSVMWIVQFLFYYYTILSQQISSDFLVNYHNRYFLSTSFAHNKEVLKSILATTYGASNISLYFNGALLIIGIVYLYIKHRSLALLITMPFILMLIAAVLKQYSLIPRLTLFSMPLVLIIIGVGLDAVFSSRQILIKAGIVALCITSFYTTKPFSVFTQPIQEEEVTAALDYLAEQNIAPHDIYIYSGAVNAYKYYTIHHPKHDRWQSITGAQLLGDADKAFQQLNTKAALLYTIPFDSYYTQKLFGQRLPITDTFTTEGATVFIYGH